MFTNELKADINDLNASSVDSALIKCNYYIDLSFQYNTRMKNTFSHIQLPIHINPMTILSKDMPRLPLDWKGEIHPIINLIFDSF